MAAKRREKKALVIGVSQYDHAEPLEFCRNDGEEMYRTLSSLGYDIAEKLIGSVKWNIMSDAIIDFFSDRTIKPEDTLLFYYSGHGVPDIDGDVYLSTSEIDSFVPDKRGFSFNQLTKLIQRSVSTRIIAILDCCYSGAAKVSKGHQEDPSILGTAAIRNASSRILKEGEGKCILASCQGLEEAFALEDQNQSLFTYYLLQGLKGNEFSVDDKGCVTPDSLGKYVYNEIMSLPADKRPRQKPVRKVEASGDIILAYYPQYVKISQSTTQNGLENRSDIKELTNVKTNIMMNEHAKTIRDLKAEVIQYIKKNKGTFTIGKCARDLNADADEIMRILSQI